MGTGIKYERYRIFERNRMVQVLYLLAWVGKGGILEIFFLPLDTGPEQERTSRECAAYNSVSRLQFKHYSPFKLIVQISQVTLTFQPSPPDQVFWTKKRYITNQPST